MYTDNQCDAKSIGSTFSNNSGPKRPKIDIEKIIFNQNDDWHVVPSGGATARSEGKTQQPHPCRYDEYERYKSATNHQGDTSGLGQIKAEFNHTGSKNGLENRWTTHTNNSDKERNEEGKKASVSDNDNGETGSSESVNINLVGQQILRKFNGGISSKNNNGKTVANSTTEKTTQGKQASGRGETNTTQDINEEERDHNNNQEGNTEDTDKVGEESTGGDNNNNKEEEERSGNAQEETTPAFDDKVLQKFVIDFKISSTPAAKIGYIHREFIKEVLMVAPSTKFVASNRRTIPTPENIETADQFPPTHFLHQKFFHRVDIRDRVSFTHDIYSSVTAMEIKRRVMAFLQEHDLGMWSEDISNNTKVRVCWILNAHSKVSYRPLMTDKLCKGIDQQKENYGDENNRLLNQLPKKMHHIEVQTRTVTHQGHQTVACCVMAYKPAAPVIRELVAMLDHDYLGNGTSIVSEAAARELDPGKYVQIIQSNTAFHQNTRTISVKYIHDLFWGVKYRPCAEANYTTVREWIMTGSGVVSIEPTKDTEKEGRYIILCKAEGFPVFRRLLQVMFQTLVKTIEEDEDLKSKALKKFQQYPTIIGPHKIGKYAEKNAQGLLSRIDVPTVPRPAIRPPSNKIEFDFRSAEGFPDIGVGIIPKKSSVKKTPKQQSWAAVAATTVATTQAGTASVGSERSEPSEAGRSYRSARTGITTSDQQTTQSDAMSVLTEFISQARQEDAERRKEEREERRIDRADRKAEAEARRRNEDRRDESNRLMFQTMMATIMANTSTATSNQVAATAASPPSTPKHADNANLIAESNTKRARQKVTNEDAISSTTATQEEVNTMEVEETVEGIQEVTGQQNHDVPKERNPSMIQ